MVKIVNYRVVRCAELTIMSPELFGRFCESNIAYFSYQGKTSW